MADNIYKEDYEKRLTDISLVTYLTCDDPINKFVPLKIKKIERNRFKSIFVFDETPDFEEKTMKYFNHEARVDPLQFSEYLRNLKSYAMSWSR